MKFAISEVFCEVVSALGFVVSFTPILILLDILSLNEIYILIKNLNGADLLWIVVLAYIFGVVLDALGLPIDRILPKLGISAQNPPEESAKNFYRNASSDLFSFRTNAWVHYYCFRNLLLFSPFALILWAIVVFSKLGVLVGGGFLIIGLIVVIVLYFAVKEHADFYGSVTRSFD